MKCCKYYFIRLNGACRGDQVTHEKSAWHQRFFDGTEFYQCGKIQCLDVCPISGQTSNLGRNAAEIIDLLQTKPSPDPNRGLRPDSVIVEEKHNRSRRGDLSF